MTNKELIERAAKAARLPECGWMGGTFMYVKDGTFTEWNPLDDDGDAFRLGVKLQMLINVSDTLASATDGDYDDCQAIGDEGAAAATRLAIVRAAARLSV